MFDLRDRLRPALEERRAFVCELELNSTSESMAACCSVWVYHSDLGRANDLQVASKRLGVIVRVSFVRGSVR